MRSYYSKECEGRLLVRVGDPNVRSNIDLFVMLNKVKYRKASRGEEDEEAPFLLHVTQVDVEGLHKDRWQAGIERIDFGFNEHGGWIDESCLVNHELRNHPELSTEAGQREPDKGQVWEGCF